MILVEQLYDWLAAGPSPDCDEILSAALRNAEPEYFDRLVALLLQRDNASAWAGLIQCYDQLPADAKAALLARPGNLHAGIARAMRSAAVEGRCNALAALDDRPTAKLAYLLPAALRDPAGKVRDASARVFRHVAETFQDTPAPPPSSPPETIREHQLEHEKMIQAVREVLRTFDRHLRVELLEACLWFADELGAELWQVLGNARLKSGRVVVKQLPTWNSPRLAAFLLAGLTHPDWRLPAQQTLRSWRTLPNAVALLRLTHMLDDPEIARSMSIMRNSEWLSALDANLSSIPAELRQHVPRWVCVLGLAEDERVRHLARWSRSTSESVQRSATYALAKLESPRALAALDRIAANPTPAGIFARWYVAGLRPGEAATASVAAQGAPAKAAASPESLADDATEYSVHESDTAAEPVSADDRPSEPTVDAEVETAAAGEVVDFAGIWRELVESPAAGRSAIIERIRPRLDEWHTELFSRLGASDPRERLLVLQVVDTAELTQRYEDELRPVLDDPAPTIRQIARKLFKLSGLQVPEPAEAPAAAGSGGAA